MSVSRNLSTGLTGALSALMLGAGIVAAAGFATGEAQACGRETDCIVDGGAYRAALPDNWDGQSPLPAAVFFHGWQSSANNVMRNTNLVSAFTGRGMLLIAPDGRQKTWSHVGSPSQARDELAFMDAVRADVMARWPIDQTLFWVTGFSQGASMAWDIACYRGADYAAFAPVAGAFWEPQALSCPTPSVNMRHIHGTSDTVVPMAGRPIGALWRQGDVLAAIELWRRQGQCAEDPDTLVVVGGLQCRQWTSCADGRQVALCLHDGGHQMPAGWVAGAWAWVQELGS